MKKGVFIVLCVGMQVSLAALLCQANEVGCVAAYGKAVSYSEAAAESIPNNDACGAASGIEMALNWAGTAENECAYDSSKLNEVRKFKNQLIPLLAKYVKLCGY